MHTAQRIGIKLEENVKIVGTWLTAKLIQPDPFFRSNDNIKVVAAQNSRHDACQEGTGPLLGFSVWCKGPLRVALTLSLAKSGFTQVLSPFR